jgi:hypothetical protein
MHTSCRALATSSSSLGLAYVNVMAKYRQLVVEVVVDPDEFFTHVGGDVSAAGGGVAGRENALPQQELCIGIREVRQGLRAAG